MFVLQSNRFVASDLPDFSVFRVTVYRLGILLVWWRCYRWELPQASLYIPFKSFQSSRNERRLKPAPFWSNGFSSFHVGSPVVEFSITCTWGYNSQPQHQNTVVRTNLKFRSSRVTVALVAYVAVALRGSVVVVSNHRWRERYLGGQTGKDCPGLLTWVNLPRQHFRQKKYRLLESDYLNLGRGSSFIKKNSAWIAQRLWRLAFLAGVM